MKYFLAMFFALSSLSAGCGTYFDTGAFNPWNFLIWSNPDESEVLNVPLYESYLEGLFSSFEQNSYDAIYLAFSQIADIDYLADPSSWSSGKVNASDVYIKNLLMQIYENCPEGTMEQFLNTFIAYAHKHNVKVYLSFGGEAASGVKICPNPQDTADQQARKLASYLIDFNFDGVDFDLEDGAISQNNTQEEIDTFFSTLKMELQAESKTSSLTVMGDIRWATIAGNLKEHFHFVQLMLYGSGGAGGKYYINAINDTWGITKWIDAVGKENASMICVGFQDDTYYENPSASASGIYIVDPNSRGHSAQMVDQQMLNDLKTASYPNTLGRSFWWPSISVKGSKGTDRYGLGPNNSSDFLSQAMIDFTKTTKTATRLSSQK